MDYFKNILGNAVAKRQLNHDILTKSCAHAYLFIGQSGIGKFTMAMELAKALLPRMKDLENPENHPDLHVINTDSSSIKKKEVEELIEETTKTAFQEETQVFMVKDFEKVTREGQNALLKTIEEPKKGIYILLTSSAPEMVLPTIRSRCRVVNIFPLAEKEVADYLQGLDKKLTKNEVELYARISAGNLQEAITFIEHPEYLLLRKRALEELIKLCTSKYSNPFETFNFFEKNKEDFSFIAKQYKLWFQDLMNFPIGGKIVHRDFFQKNIILPNLKGEVLYDLWDVVDKTEQNLKNNGNFQLQVENMLLHIQEEYHDTSGGGSF
ncbi:MAG: AAA family ATPase [Tissierellia bacterium]|nr:AAA family ATPase [Tissierellia bacterium]